VGLIYSVNKLTVMLFAVLSTYCALYFSTKHLLLLNCAIMALAALLSILSASVLTLIITNLLFGI